MSEMIEFQSLTIKNFLSYGAIPTTVVLNKPGTTIILGEDLDNTASGAGANGVGKALTLDSMIKTPTSWVPMGEISVGDLIQTPSGEAAPVSGVFPQGEVEVYRVTFSDGRWVDACEDHLWKVSSHRWGKNGKSNAGKIISTTELKTLVDEAVTKNKAWYNITIPTVNHPIIENVELPIPPYVIGALLGDGCLSAPQIRFSTLDTFLIENIQQQLAHTDAKFIKDTEEPDWRVNGLDLKNQLNQLGLLNRKSRNKFIPRCYMEGTSQEQKLNLLQGLLDTDGTVGGAKNVTFCSVSRQLAEDVQYLIRSIGGRAKITTRPPLYTYKGELLEGQLAYNVSIQYSNPHDLFTLDRKLDWLSEGDIQYSGAGLRVSSVVHIGLQPAQCIMVDHIDHLFITNDFIVTHNTVILNALVYGCYDRAISDIQKDNLVNNINKKKMEVEISFIKKDVTYVVKRYRKMKAGAAGNYVVLLKDNKDITPDSIANTNKLIEEIIGIPYEIFVRVVAFSATLMPFLDLPVRSHYAANQTDIIEELFDLKSLSEKAEVLKEVMKDTNASLKTQTIRMEQQQLELERHKTQVTSAEQRITKWDADNQQEIDDINRKLKKVEEVDIDEQQELNNQRDTAMVFLRERLASQKAVEVALRQVSPKLKKAEGDLEHLQDDECPFCLQKYPNAAAAITTAEEEIESFTKDISDLSEELEIVDADVAKINENLAEINKAITVSNVDELLEIKSKVSVYHDRIKELTNSVNPFIVPLDELNDIEFDDINMDNINELTTLIDHQKFLLKLLTKKDSFVRKTLLNKNIPFLNARLQHYLTELGLPHTVEFTHEMTASISQFSRPMDFGNLSNGQRARVNLALSFAFRDVLQHRTSRVNVCMLDEVLDVGLDTVGVQNAARMLKQKARDEGLALFIITHRDEIDSAFDNKMIVQLENGFSYIKGDRV